MQVSPDSVQTKHSCIKQLQLKLFHPLDLQVVLLPRTKFQVFLSLWSVTSCLCIDKIPKVAKTKEIFYIKVKTLPRPPKMAHSNKSPHVYIIVWEDLQNVSVYSRNPCSLNRERDAALNASGTPTA